MIMNNIDHHILEVNKVICSNINKFDVSERGLLSQNVLSQLRNFVEHISLKIYIEAQGDEVANTYENITNANAYVRARGDLKFLKSFHKLLQITASHYTLDEEKSERLMLKYLEYLIRAKSFLKSNYDLDVLENLSSFHYRLIRIWMNIIKK
jgi:hypothetical protein